MFEYLNVRINQLAGASASKVTTGTPGRRDRIGTAKHLHCRIARPDPVLRSICDRYKRISPPGTGY